MKHNNEKKCENYCPKCGSKEIEWQSKDFTDDQIYQDAECLDCGCGFTEWWAYSITTYNPQLGG